MTIGDAVQDDYILTSWGDAVKDSINHALLGGQAITELATSPAGTDTNELQWSSTHQTMMRWTGTQWRFAGGPPHYMSAMSTDCTWIGTGTGDHVSGDYACTLIASGTVALATTATSAHPGVIRVTTGAATNSGGGYLLTATSFVAGAGLRFRGVFNLPASNANHLIRIGFVDTVTQADCTDGMYLEIANVTGTFKTAQGGNRTSNATTAALATSAWYTVHIWQTDATHASCVLMRDDGTSMLNVSNSANVPSGTGQLFGAGFMASRSDNATGNNLIDVDYLGAGYAQV